MTQRFKFGVYSFHICIFGAIYIKTGMAQRSDAYSNFSSGMAEFRVNECLDLPTTLIQCCDVLHIDTADQRLFINRVYRDLAELYPKAGEPLLAATAVKISCDALGWSVTLSMSCNAAHAKRSQVNQFLKKLNLSHKIQRTSPMDLIPRIAGNSLQMNMAQQIAAVRICEQLQTLLEGKTAATIAATAIHIVSEMIRSCAQTDTVNFISKSDAKMPSLIDIANELRINQKCIRNAFREIEHLSMYLILQSTIQECRDEPDSQMLLNEIHQIWQVDPESNEIVHFFPETNRVIRLQQIVDAAAFITCVLIENPRTLVLGVYPTSARLFDSAMLYFDYVNKQRIPF